MNVLQVAMRLDPALGGSTASTISNILAEQRDGVKNTVVFAAGPDDDVRTRPVVASLHAAGARVLRFPRVPRPARASAQFGLSRSAAEWLAGNLKTFDLVHVHGPWGATTGWSLVLARRHGLPTVLTPRESLTIHDRETSRSRVRAVAKTGAWRLIPHLVDVVVNTSNLERADSPATGRLGSRIVWHAVVDGAVARPATERALSDDPAVTIGYLGRIDPKKNVHLLIDAVATNPDTRLVIAGQGEDGLEAELREQVSRLGLQDRVQFLGFIAATALSAFFARIDVLALPSNYENFGMAAAEALQHGVPAMVSERTGIAEVINMHGGGSTVSLDPTAIALCAISLGRRRREQAFAKDAQRVAYDHLSYAAHARKARQLYDELVGGRT